MAEYIIRLEEGVKLSDICDIEDDGCVWINHHYANGLGETTPDTMAIELPPHGRCIDADTVANYFFNYLKVCSPLMNMEKAKELVEAVKEALKIAPTVLEATE